MRSDRWSTCEIASSSSTTRTRGGRSKWATLTRPMVRTPNTAGARRPASKRAGTAMATTPKKRPTRKPAARKSRRPATRPLHERLHLIAHPQLEPHHVDIIALALILAGIFLAGVGYLHWSGGTLGNATVTAFRFVLGPLGYA